MPTSPVDKRDGNKICSKEGVTPLMQRFLLRVKTIEREQGANRMHTTISKLEVLHSSPSERERLWGRVCEFMDGTGLDVIVVPSHYDPFDLLQRSINRTSGEEGPYL